MGKSRRIPGALERAARGEGIICPKCRTLAVLGRGGVCRCPSCGQEIRKEKLGKGGKR
jgi:rubrerythrin